MPTTWTMDAFASFTLAILLLFTGKLLTQRIGILRRYSIPEPVTGGFLCAVVVTLLYAAFDIRVEFTLDASNMLLLYFFAGIGLKSDIRTLGDGGRPLLVLLALASLFIVIQNLLGMSVAGWFGMDARAGLMTGSVSLTGGIGTTYAWVDYFTQGLGITNALELGMASNMVGLIAACVVGGPIASWLIRRYGIDTSQDPRLDIGQAHEEQAPPLDYYSVLRAWLWLNLALMLGQIITALINAETTLKLPTFVGCLLAGILIRNLLPRLPGPHHLLLGNWSGIKNGLALISDICLGMFITMALMGLQLWVLQGVFGFVLTVLTLQIILAVAYSLWVVYPCMGRNYEAAVASAGFGGIALGSTATAIANMTAVTQQYGAAHRAFIVVPLVCGFFIDLVNALVISQLA